MLRKKLKDKPIKPKGVSKEGSKYLFPLVIVLGLIVYWLFAIDPLFQKSEKMNEQIETAKIQYQRFVGLFSNREEYTSQFSQYGNYVVQKMRDEEEIALFLKHIEELTGQLSGRLLVTDIKPRPMESKGSIKKLFVQIEVEAESQALANFMYKIGTTNELMRIEQYVITAKDRRSGVAEGSFLISKMLISN